MAVPIAIHPLLPSHSPPYPHPIITTVPTSVHKTILPKKRRTPPISLTQNACTNCKKAKTKCSGPPHPCTRCFERAIPSSCNFPPQAKTAKMELSMQLRELEDRNERLEGEVEWARERWQCGEQALARVTRECNMMRVGIRRDFGGPGWDHKGGRGRGDEVHDFGFRWEQEERAARLLEGSEDYASILATSSGASTPRLLLR